MIFEIFLTLHSFWVLYHIDHHNPNDPIWKIILSMLNPLGGILIVIYILYWILKSIIKYVNKS